MLTVYLDRKEAEKSGMEIIRDPISIFNINGITDTDVIRSLLSEIEQAEYLNNQCFIDRFNCKVPIEFLSNGTKIAIACTYVHDKIIDLIECGFNARDSIFRYVDNAYVLAYSVDYGVDYRENDSKNKKFFCNGYTFNGLESLSDYIYNDYPDEPSEES